MENLVLVVEPITPAENLVLDEVNKGKSDKQIAVSLFLSVKTVKHHMGELLEKLNAESRLQVVLTARELGLVDTPDTISPTATVILALLHMNPDALNELLECGALDFLDAPKGD